MFTGHFAQITHLFWRISQHSQAPLVSYRTRHAHLISVPTLSNFPDVIARHIVSLCYSTKVNDSETSANICNNDMNKHSTLERSYEVVVAATRDMGIGKDGKLPWNLPSDLRYFKEVTTSTSIAGKRNAVVMGRRTWESIPQKYRPLPGRLNIVLTRSGKLEAATFDDLVICNGLSSALKLLAEPPHSLSVEKVFVIGGGQVLKEALNAPGCESIHLTDIETDIECDTFIPQINLSLFHMSCKSDPVVENDIQFSFVTYVRSRISAEESPASQNGIKCDTSFASDKFTE